MASCQLSATDVAANCFFNGLNRESQLVNIVAHGDAHYLSIPIDILNVIKIKVLQHSKTGMNCYSTVMHRCNNKGLELETLSFEEVVSYVLANDELVGIVSDKQKRAFLNAVLESHRNTWVALEQMTSDGQESIWRFLDAEQSLFVGHSMHPAPKSRSGLSLEASRQLSPELNASFQLRWFAASTQVMTGDTGDNKEWQAYLMMLVDHDESLSGTVRAYSHRDGWNVFPMHPWQAERLLEMQSIQGHVESGQLIDLGTGGQPWYATSSTRAVFSPHSPFMLKYSLSVKLTNSIRLLSEKEVKRGVSLARICDALSGKQKQYLERELTILQEPAYVGILDDNEKVIDESLLVVRTNPFHDSTPTSTSTPKPTPKQSQAVLATLCQQTPQHAGDTILSSVIHSQVNVHNTSSESLALEWFEQFCDKVVIPIFRLQSELGIVLLAHQQNIVVEMEEGLPVKSYFRDCQGVGFTELACQILPDIGAPEETENFWGRDKVNRYFPYYLIINSTYGVIASLSSLVSEDTLFRVLREKLRLLHQEELADKDCLSHVLESPALCCKGNFFCYLHGFNENSIPDPSVIYFDLHNPIKVAEEGGL